MPGFAKTGEGELEADGLVDGDTDATNDGLREGVKDGVDVGVGLLVGIRVADGVADAVGELDVKTGASWAHAGAMEAHKSNIATAPQQPAEP